MAVNVPEEIVQSGDVIEPVASMVGAVTLTEEEMAPVVATVTALITEPDKLVAPMVDADTVDAVRMPPAVIFPLTPTPPATVSAPVPELPAVFAVLYVLICIVELLLLTPNKCLAPLMCIW